MSRTIDEKVVSMQFDNREFERNVQTTMGTVSKLKESLNFTGATKGLTDIGTAAKSIDMSGLSSGVEAVSVKFSALQVFAVNALNDIYRTAKNVGTRMVSALTIDPIKTGFQEYETQINAVQTILANTSSKGTTLDDVNDALDTLNTYADKTIYNFTEMTRNIGTFTAAGVDLDTSVSSIQGIANLAAVSGSTSQQASTAMYQLSQALAAGKVSLMDWNSVVNAGMGGQVFQDALKRTAKTMGKDVDGMIKKYGSFRESLTQGEWLTTDVLTKTLEQFTMAAEEGSDEWENFKKSLMSEGYTEKQAEEILKMANTATDAATKVKTFTQLWDTLKEAAQSGWTQTWEIIVGDFEEAKSLLTSVSNTINEIIGKSAESRNNLLQGWKDLGGRTDLIESFKNVFEGLVSVITPIGEAFKDIFPAMTAKQLHSITAGLKEFTSKLKLSDENAERLKRTFKGVFSVFDILRKVLTIVAKAIGGLLTGGGVSGVLDLILSITGAIGDFFTTINKGFQVNGIAGLFGNLGKAISGGIGKAAEGLTGFGDALASLGKWIANVLGDIWEGFKTVFGWIFDNVSAGDVFAGLAGGGILMLAKKIAGPFDKLKDLFSNGILGALFGGGKGDAKEEVASFKDMFKDVLGSAGESLQAFTSGIKVASLVAIAAAIAILSSALKKISEIDVGDLVTSLTAMGIMFKMLTSSFTNISKSVSLFGSSGFMKTGAMLMMFAKGIDILADAMTKISKLSLEGVAKGLVGIGGSMYGLTKGLNALAGVKIPISTSISMLALAESCKMLGDALAKFGKMTWEEIARGLIAMGGALGEFVIVLKSLSKVGSWKTLLGSGGLVVAVQALEPMAEALQKFGSMSWDEIGRGLTAMGGALLELGGVTGALGKLAGFSGIIGGTALVTAVESLDDLASALEKFSWMNWDEIGRGLAAMGGALAELGTVTGVLGKLAGFSGIFGGAALDIAAQSLAPLAEALEKCGSMSWDEIAQGLSAMGGALVELGGVTGALGELAGFSGILGGGALVITIQGLDQLATAFQKFGSMSWDEIGRGLVAMGGALLEIGVISGTLGYLTNIAGILGGAAIWISVQGLDQLATAFQKFGSMSWDEIGRGLAAMGGALAELALGGLLNTLSIIGSYSISEVAAPMGVLADSMKKWKDVTIPSGLGLQLGILADGVLKFTLGGWGASAIAEVAGPLGTMADSVKKWSDVVLPETMLSSLYDLADGIKSFTWGGWGASTITEVSGSLGTLADSIKKWKDVAVPENLKTQLTGIADGVKAFSWAFMGGWSLSAIDGPLGSLADSIKKWKDVVIPEGLGAGLKDIADGIGAFSWLFLGGWSLSAIDGPLGTLADSIKKWEGLVVPENLGTNLGEIAKGIKEFNWIFTGGYNLGEIAVPLGQLADSVVKWKDITVPEDLGTNLGSVATAIKNFSGITNITTGTTALTSITTACGKLQNIKFKTITDGLSSVATSLTTFATSAANLTGVGSTIVSNVIDPINKANSKFKEAGTSLIKALTDGFTSNKDGIKSAADSIVSAMISAIKDKKTKFESAGKDSAKQYASGIKKTKSDAEDSMKAVIKAALDSIDDYNDDFESAGKDLGKGLVNGIAAKETAVYNAAYKLGQKAVQGEKDGQESNSPSKATTRAGKWLGEGLIVGMKKIGNAVYNASYGMGNTATSTISNALSHISEAINSDIDTQPTIRPVLDLSDISSGAGAINGLLGTPSVGVLSNVRSINTMMNRRNQNGVNDDVVSAIKNLETAMNNKTGDTYSINGITYSGESDVANAIQTLVRAVKTERRT